MSNFPIRQATEDAGAAVERHTPGPPAARLTLRTCRGCGCDDRHACPCGCAWVLVDIAFPTGICSTCADEMEWDMQLLATECCDVAAAVIERAERRLQLREA